MSLSVWCLLALMPQSLQSKMKQQKHQLTISNNISISDYININSNSNNDNLENWLSLPTKDIPHLKLMLRKKFVQQDAENIYTHWFLKRSTCQLSIASYDDDDDADDGEINQTTTKTLHRGGGGGVGSSGVVLNRLNYVIVTDMEHLSSTSKRFLQRAGNFFFIISDQIEFERLRDILQLMWINLNVYKIFILTTSDGVLFFDPFDYDAKRLRYGMIRNYAGKQHLERLLFKNMRGYPLRIQMFKSVYARPRYDQNSGKVLSIDGVDGEVARLLEERMNFTMILQDPDPDYFGERDTNGTYNGAIGSIIKNEIDMSLTGFFIKDYMVPEMEFTVAIYDDKLCIYVPKASRVPQSILPIFAVSYNLWISFISTAFACATIWWLIRRINLWLEIKALEKTVRLVRKSHWFQFMRIYTDTWVVWVRVNVKHYPPFHSERIFLTSLSLVSVIFGAIFDSSLATVYIHPMYYNDINTMRELDDSGLKIIYKYSSMADDLFFSDTSPLFANLNKKLTHLKDLNADVILDVARYGGKAGVSRYTSLMLESIHFIVSKRVWVIPECPKYYAISYVMPKDSPWSEAVNNLLLQFLNAGLIVKWIDDMEAQADRKIMKEHLFESIDNFKVLTVADLQLAFYVVFSGSFLAILSFMIETILSGLIKKRDNRSKIRLS